MKAKLLFILLIAVCITGAHAQQRGDINLEADVGYAVSDDLNGLSAGVNLGYSVTDLIAVKAGYSAIQLSSGPSVNDVDIDKFALFGETLGYLNRDFGLSGILGGSVLNFDHKSGSSTAGGFDIGTKLRYVPNSQFDISLKILNNFNTENDYIVSASLTIEYRLR